MGLTSVIIAFCFLLQATESFSPTLSSHRMTRLTSRLADAITVVDATYPPLPQDEIRKLLDTVPVYAVRDSSDETKDGLVLLKEKGNSNSLAYFFFSAEMANDVYRPLREQQEASGAIWDVTAFPLGLIWFDLLNNPVQNDSNATPWINNGIEYRLAAIPEEVEAAKSLIRQGASEDEDVATTFPENFIPIFVINQLRLQGTEERVPLYLSIQDLLQACQQAEVGKESGFDAAVNVADLCSLISQMQQHGHTDFRRAIFIPPSSPSSSTIEQSQKKPRIQVECPEDLDLPMATDLWSD